MATQLTFGASIVYRGDLAAARTRAAKLSARAAMVIGAATICRDISYHYKGFLGFILDCDDIIWIGPQGAVRRTRGIDGSPRRHHARLDLAARLERMGRRAMIMADLQPASYRRLVGRFYAYQRNDVDRARAEAVAIRTAVDQVRHLL
jgi:hypothetical protein